MKFERQERGLVRPIFEQCALAFRPPGGAVEEASVITTQTRKCWQIMCPHQHVDAVDLVESEPLDSTAKVTAVHSGWSWNAEALCCERNAPSGLQCEFLDDATPSSGRKSAPNCGS